MDKQAMDANNLFFVNLLGDVFTNKTSSFRGHVNDLRRINILMILRWANKKEERGGNVHICGKSAVHLTSVLEDFSILVFCCQLQLFLPLHVAVASQHSQVAGVDGQQHHRAGKSPIADVSKALPGHHDEDPEGTKNRKSERVQQQNTVERWWKVTRYTVFTQAACGRQYDNYIWIWDESFVSNCRIKYTLSSFIHQQFLGWHFYQIMIHNIGP